jgi:hypothetical protein
MTHKVFPGDRALDVFSRPGLDSWQSRSPRDDFTALAGSMIALQVDGENSHPPGCDSGRGPSEYVLNSLGAQPERRLGFAEDQNVAIINGDVNRIAEVGGQVS